LAACAAGAVVGALAAGGGGRGRVEASSAPRAELSPAEIVALRFGSNPAFANAKPAPAVGYGLASVESVPAPRPATHHVAHHTSPQDPHSVSREALSAYQNYASLAGPDTSLADDPAGPPLAYAEPAPTPPRPPATAAPATMAQHATPPARPATSAAPTSASNALLNAAQIASLHERLKLSSYQQQMWPPVEAALREITYHQDRNDKSRKSSYRTDRQPALIDTSSAEVQRLKSAAIPLIMSMNEDQKQEVRTMARLMGLEQLASQF
jgi:hypothetical protein